MQCTVDWRRVYEIESMRVRINYCCTSNVGRKDTHDLGVQTKSHLLGLRSQAKNHFRDCESRPYLVQFTAGMAYPLVRACVRRVRRSSPVTTPGGTISARDMVKIQLQFGIVIFDTHTLEERCKYL